MCGGNSRSWFWTNRSTQATLKKPKGGQRSGIRAAEIAVRNQRLRAKSSPSAFPARAQSANVPRPTLHQYLPGMRAKGWIRTVGEGNGARKHITHGGPAGAGTLEGKGMTCQHVRNPFPTVCNSPPVSLSDMLSIRQQQVGSIPAVFPTGTTNQQWHATGSGTQSILEDVDRQFLPSQSMEQKSGHTAQVSSVATLNENLSVGEPKIQTASKSHQIIRNEPLASK